MRIVPSTLVHEPHRWFMALFHVTLVGRSVISGANWANKVMQRVARADSSMVLEASEARILATISGTITRSSALLNLAGIDTMIWPPWRYAAILRFLRVERMTTISPSVIPGSSGASTRALSTRERKLATISPSYLKAGAKVGESALVPQEIILRAGNEISNFRKKKCFSQLILGEMSRTLRLRSPRITVLCLQGEGRQRIERPGTSPFFALLVGQAREIIWHIDAVQVALRGQQLFLRRQYPAPDAIAGLNITQLANLQPE
jgi:hypothetical protein